MILLGPPDPTLEVGADVDDASAVYEVGECINNNKRLVNIKKLEMVVLQVGYIRRADNLIPELVLCCLTAMLLARHLNFLRGEGSVRSHS